MSNRSPRILIFFDDAEMSESNNAVLALLESLDQKQFPYRCLLPSYDGPLAEYLRSRSIEFDAIELPKRGAFFGGAWAHLGYFRKLFRFFKMYSFELVHAVGTRACALSIALKIRFNVPLVWHLWKVFPNGPSLWFFGWMAAVFCDHIIACSLLVAHQLGRTLHWRERLSVLYRGYASSTPASIRASLPVVATAGGMVPWKGYEVFLRAIELARREVPACQGIIFHRADCEGYSSYERELTGLISELGLHDVVRVEKVAAGSGELALSMREAGVRVFVSGSVRLEPFESSAAEAMGCGLPIVAARTGVLIEMIEHERTGLLVTPGDANDLAHSITRLLAEEGLRQAIGIQAMHEHNSRFNIKRYVASVQAIYQEKIPGVDADDDKGEQKKAA